MFNIVSTTIRVQLVALPLVAWGLERLVESARPRLTLAGSAVSVTQCLPALEKHMPDVVVLDLDGEGGTDTLARLRSRTQARIIALTGSCDELLHDSAVLAGASGVIGKHDAAGPVNLLKAIEKVHEGEIWLDRNATSRIFLELARRQSAQADDPEQEKIARLTRREQQTIASLVRNPSTPSKHVAAQLHISEHTLRNHLSSIYGKLGLTSRVDLYAYAQRHGIAA